MIRKHLILIGLCFSFAQMHSQFLRGVGVFAGAVTSRHKMINTNLVDTLYSHRIPAPSHQSAEYVNWSAGILFECLKYQNVRWQTEIEYCNKGAVENPFLSPASDVRTGKTANTLSYVQWNNYVKIFFREGYVGTPYVMLGARAEYNIRKSVTAYSAVVSAIPKIRINPDVALGYEFTSYSNFKLFTELHYNPDVISKNIGNIKFTNRTWELRVGIIYRRSQKAIDDCNAPRYHGGDY